MGQGQGPGSIPARAGEPRCCPTAASASRVYPRACGGTTYRVEAATNVHGLSPRVRGNPSYTVCPRPPFRSIPARAGEPIIGQAPNGLDKVYPRACGGTAAQDRHVTAYDGLSPRVRGNRVGPAVANCGRRSIPARAGEPSCFPDVSRILPVYPRACGGTNDGGGIADPGKGLSPRVRGNPAGSLPGKSLTRSIPARAGEPIP